MSLPPLRKHGPLASAVEQGAPSERPTAAVPTEQGVPTRPTVAPPAPGVVAGVVAVVAVGVALRFVARSDLWLDEALSVNIARLPLSRLPEALRHDGSPPLYYFLLHAWMSAFGTGDLAVRALSGGLSVATLPVLWLAGRRLAGAPGGWAALVLAASNPFALRYATETRMYALVALEVSLGLLALLAALERPTWPRLAALSAATAALLLTHYWGFYLGASVGTGLVLYARRSRFRRRAGLRAGAALVVGAVAFTPWLPSFLFQVVHTGTPWAQPPRVGAVVNVLDDLAGGAAASARLLALLSFALALLALLGRPVGRGRVELRLPPVTPAAMLAGVVLATSSLAMAAGRLSHSAFAGRYLAVVLPAFLLLVALGAVTVPGPRGRALVVGAGAVLGLATGIQGATVNRTQAGEVARAIAAGARPGDVVAFCPDQLGPAVSRLLARTPAARLPQITYPRGGRPERVDWVDYDAAIKASSTRRFARLLLQRAGPGHAVWLYRGRGYRPYAGRCTVLAGHLLATSPGHTTVLRAEVETRLEHGTLTRFLVP